MQAQWSDFVADPKMQLVWGIAGALLTIIVLYATEPEEPRAQAIRQVVYEATGIRCPNPKLVMWSVLAWVFGLLCFVAGVLLNVEQIKRGHARSVAGWLLMATALPSGLWGRRHRRRAFPGFIESSFARITKARLLARI
jgi:hypothetical protein